MREAVAMFCWSKKIPRGKFVYPCKVFHLSCSLHLFHIVWMLQVLNLACCIQPHGSNTSTFDGNGVLPLHLCWYFRAIYMAFYTTIDAMWTSVISLPDLLHSLQTDGVFLDVFSWNALKINNLFTFSRRFPVLNGTYVRGNKGLALLMLVLF